MIRNTVCSICLLFFCLLSFSLPAGEKKVLVYMASGICADDVKHSANPVWAMMVNGSWAEGYHAAWTLQGKAALDDATEKAPRHVSAATGLTAAHHAIVSDEALKQYSGAALPTFMELMGRKKPGFHSAVVAGRVENTMLHPEHGRWQCVCCQDPDVDWNARNLHYLCNMLSWNDTPDAFFVQDEVMIPPPGKTEMPPPILTLNRFGEVLKAIARRRTFRYEDWLIIFCSDAGGEIPFWVCGKNVPSGTIKGSCTLLDIAPWCLHHLGADEFLAGLDGNAGILTESR